MILFLRFVDETMQKIVSISAHIDQKVLNMTILKVIRQNGQCNKLTCITTFL